MKIIEGLKKIKDLQRKVSDLQTKIGNHSAHLNYETPVYDNQKDQVTEWLQAHRDVLKEILRLRLAIQRTNLLTEVTIELGGIPVKKCIAAWIHRRRDIATTEARAYQMLTDRNLKEGQLKESTGEIRDIKIVRCYDPEHRDTVIELLTSEPTTIDSRLEVINAITDLIEE